MPRYNAKLTPKEERFVEAYVANGGNGTQAVISAGYNVNGDKSASTISTHILGRVGVQKSLNELKHEAALELGFTPKYILNELASFKNYGDVYLWLAAVKEIKKMLGYDEKEKVVIEIENDHEEFISGAIIDMEKESE